MRWPKPTSSEGRRSRAAPTPAAARASRVVSSTHATSTRRTGGIPSPNTRSTKDRAFDRAKENCPPRDGCAPEPRPGCLPPNESPHLATTKVPSTLPCVRALAATVTPSLESWTRSFERARSPSFDFFHNTAHGHFPRAPTPSSRSAPTEVGGGGPRRGVSSADRPRGKPRCPLSLKSCRCAWETPAPPTSRAKDPAE